METRDYTTCFYCNNTKIKVNKILKHKEICKSKPSDMNSITVSCPYNSYHWVRLSELEFHKDTCPNKPNDKSNEKKKEEFDLQNALQEYLNNQTLNEFKDCCDSTKDMTKIELDTINQTTTTNLNINANNSLDYSFTNQLNTTIYNPNEIREEDIYNYNL